MSRFTGVFTKWLSEQISENNEESYAEKRGKALLRKIHESLRDHYKDKDPSGTKQVIERLNKAVKESGNKLRDTGISSQSSYLKFIRKEFAHDGRWLEKATAIMEFLFDYCGVILFLRDSESMKETDSNSLIDEESTGELLVDENGFPIYQISEESYISQVKTLDGVRYIGYYWRHDNVIGISELLLYKEGNRKGVYKSAKMKFYYDSRTVSLEGEIETPGISTSDTNLYIKLIDNKEQLEENKKDNSLPVISNVAIYIKDTSKKWEDRQILFGAYSSSHRKYPKHTYSGIFCFLNSSLLKVGHIDHTTEVPDFISHFLFRKRLEAPTDPIHNLEMFKPYEQIKVLKDVYVGVYKLYYINQRDRTLEIAICEIQPSGYVRGKTEGRTVELSGQCICIKNEFIFINFNYVSDDVHLYPNLSYIAERSIPDDCLLGVYIGVRSTKVPMSGRAYFERVKGSVYETLKPEKLDFGNKKDKIKDIFFDNANIYKYLLGTKQRQEPTDAAILNEYLTDRDDKSENSLIVDYAGEYLIYTSQINGGYSRGRNELSFSQYPIQINKNGSVVIKGRRNPYYTGNSYYNDGILRIHITSPINLHFNIAYNVHFPNKYSKGIVVRKVDSTVDGRALIMVKGNKGDFSLSQYREDIDIWGAETETIDKAVNGGLSYLRGVLNRYIHIDNREDFRPRNKDQRRLHFYAACYLSKSVAAMAILELREAFLHGFSARAYLGLSIYDSIYDANDYVLSLREDWKLLLKEASKVGALSNDILLLEIRKYWGEDFEEFYKAKGGNFFTFGE
jgi:hypothetical protein